MFSSLYLYTPLLLSGCPWVPKDACPFEDPSICEGSPGGEGDTEGVDGDSETNSEVDSGSDTASPPGCCVHLNDVAAATFYGEAQGDWFGIYHSGVGDLDGDEQIDIAISAPYYHDLPKEDPYYWRGATYLFFGPFSGEISADPSISKDTRFLRVLGEEDIDFLGHTIFATDLEDDGYTDLFLGATGYLSEGGTEQGAVYRLSGPLGEGITGPTDLDLSKTPRILGRDYTPTDPYPSFGSAITAGRFLGEDEQIDLVIGAPVDNVFADDDGKVYLIDGLNLLSGSYEAQDHIADASYLLGEAAHDNLGEDLASVDMGCDGIEDIVISAGQRDNKAGAGRLYLFRGGPDFSLNLGEVFMSSSPQDALVLGEAVGDRLGVEGSLAQSLDSDNDGCNDDILVAAPRHDDQRGAVYLLEAPEEGTISVGTAPVKILGDVALGEVVGQDEGDQLGGWLASLGDIDGDGRDDLSAVSQSFEETEESSARSGGAPPPHTGEHTGAAYVVLTPLPGTYSVSDVSITTLMGEQDATIYGVSGVGDVDGDLVPDLLAGSYGWSDFQGTSHIVSLSDYLPAK